MSQQDHAHGRMTPRTREIVEAAVEQNFRAMAYASKEMEGYQEIMEMAENKQDEEKEAEKARAKTEEKEKAAAAREAANKAINKAKAEAKMAAAKEAEMAANAKANSAAASRNWWNPWRRTFNVKTFNM